MNRAIYKNKAKQLLKTDFKKIVELFIPYLVLNLVYGGYSSYMNTNLTVNKSEIKNGFAISGDFTLNLLIGVVSAIMILGIMDGILNKKFSIGQSFKYFSGEHFKTALFLVLTELFFTLVWILIPLAGIVIAIIKSYAYALVGFLYIKGERFDTMRDYLRESERLTKGHKLDLFIFGLSFLGWYFVVLFTLGIAGFWVLPYIVISHTYLYEAIYNKDV